MEYVQNATQDVIRAQPWAYAHNVTRATFSLKTSVSLHVLQITSRQKLTELRHV
jgi:hypothetical protein